MKLFKQLFIIFFITAAVVSSCKKEVTPAKPVNVHMKFNFSHTVDNAPLELNTIKYLNKAGNLYSVTDLRYFICNITLHKGNDSILINEAHYIDASSSSSCTYSPGQVIPNGSYDYISFIIGLDPAKNVTNAFVNPPESNMEWPTPMGGGYHYMQLQGRFDSATVVKLYAVHTGALNHVPYYIPVRLAQSAFTADGDDLTVNLAMNINEWFENPNTYDLNTYGDTVMSSVSAQQVLHQNGADVFTVSSIK